jgi:hypothetical protein
VLVVLKSMKFLALLASRSRYRVEINKCLLLRQREDVPCYDPCFWFFSVIRFGFHLNEAKQTRRNFSFGSPIHSLAIRSRNRALRTATLSYHYTSPSVDTEMASSGTFRGTPGRGQGRGNIPTFTNSPSAIPRPTLETHGSSTSQSEAGGSTMSASRQKQSKRDEV